MADEVEALKRELEALKLQLEKERKTSAAVQGDTDSPKQLAGPPRDESPKPKRRGGDAKTSAAPKEPRIYVQHAAVGTRRGKWWLRDRQVLSRAMLEEGGATLKLRETWVWSGRSVVLDKIVRIQEVEGGQEDATLEEEVVMEEEAAVTGEVVEDPAARSASPRTAATVPREAQESEAAETSRSPTTTGEKAGANAVVEEEALTPQKSGKADDEVRESSAPVQPGPPVASANI
ncbi:hypothetical protein PRIC2_002094 [Phytophthora ramorum]